MENDIMLYWMIVNEKKFWNVWSDFPVFVEKSRSNNERFVISHYSIVSNVNQNNTPDAQVKEILNRPNNTVYCLSIV